MGTVDGDGSRDELVTRLMAGGRPKDAIEEQRALAALEHRLLGSSPEHTVTLSRYVLLERLGSGGVGVVHAAYDPELDRKVAIKLLRSDLGDDDSRTGSRARLLREAQALAKLSHPNVISVYDVGTYEAEDLSPSLLSASDRVHERGVFVVMELVEGLPLHQWLKLRERSVVEVLRVFVAAGHGLAAAHEAGLVHRDFKPANVLVGSDGRVRVLDFGLARQAGVEMGEAEVAALPEPTSSERIRLDSPLTEAGTVMGTPPYMSPEQHRGEPVDAASDQFSFCTALYEALYGIRPFAGATMPRLRAEKESGPPLDPPSDRAPARIHRAVVRGLAPQPTARHPSMRALLRELEHDAGFRRRRLTIAALGLVAVASVGFAAWVSRDARDSMCDGRELALEGVWDDAVRARVHAAFTATARPFAQAAADSVTRLLDAHAAAWVRASVESCRETMVERTQPRELMDKREACLGRRRAELEELTRLLAVADAQLVERSVAAAGTLAPPSDCLDPALLGDEVMLQGTAADQLVAIERDLARALGLMQAARYDEARRLAERAVAGADELGHPTTRARALLRLGGMLQEMGQADAEDMLWRAFTTAEQAGADDLGTHALIRLVGVVGTAKARYAEADRLVQQAEARIQRRGLHDDLEARLLFEIGNLRHSQAQYDAAATAHRRALAIRQDLLPPDHPSIAAGLNAIGLVHYQLGDYARAQEHFQRALDIYERVLGPDHPEVASISNNLGITEHAVGHRERAIEHHTRALAIRKAAFDGPHPMTLISYSNLGNVHQEAGEYAAALEYQEQAAAMARAVHGDAHPTYGMAEVNRGTALLALGRPDDALEAQQRALAVYERSLPADHPSLGYPLVNMAEVLVTLGRADEAVDRAIAARTIWEARFGRDHPLVLEALTIEGLSLLAAGEHARAATVLERAVAGWKTETDPVGRITAQLGLAGALARTERERAGALRREARAELEKLDAQRRAQIERWFVRR